MASTVPLVIDNGDGTHTPVVATADTVTVTAVQDYDVACFLAGKPANSAIVMRHVAARAFVLPIHLTGSEANAAVASTSTKVYAVLLNGVGIGTITFTASDTGVFAAAAETDVSEGDIVSITAPAVQDATLQDVSITLKGTLA